jgi:exonuclease VII small subunit
MEWIKDINSLYDFIGYVVLRAPDRFPKEDFLSESEQMNLEKAFIELQNGIKLIEREFPGADKERGLSMLLERALASYRNGETVSGAHLLQEFEALVFKR